MSTTLPFTTLIDMSDNLSVKHNVTLTEGEISTILSHLQIVSEKYGTSDEIERIFEELEGVVDEWYAHQERIKEQLEWYNNQELKLTPFQEELEVKKYIRANDDSDYSKIPSRY